MKLAHFFWLFVTATKTDKSEINCKEQWRLIRHEIFNISETRINCHETRPKAKNYNTDTKRKNKNHPKTKKSMRNPRQKDANNYVDLCLTRDIY